MDKLCVRKLPYSVLIVSSILLVTGCAEFGPGYGGGPGGGYGNNPYGSGSGGYYDDDYYYQRERERELKRERKEVERERDRLEDERRQLERERDRAREEAARKPPPEHCPSGFSPSEQKCSREERKRGCKDMRLPGGLGCVRR